MFGGLGPGTAQRDVDWLSRKGQRTADERSLPAQRTGPGLCALSGRTSRSLPGRIEKLFVARLFLHRRREQGSGLQHVQGWSRRTGHLRSRAGEFKIEEVADRQILT